MFNPVNAATINRNRIEVDENLLRDNLDWKPDLNLDAVDWEPMEIKDYDLSSRMYLDIETTGLDPETSEIIMIGIMLEGDYPNANPAQWEKLQNGLILEDREDEASIINRLFRAIEVYNPEIISLHNGVDFDIPYIIGRCRMLGIDCLFSQLPDTKMMNSASVYGQAIAYKPVYCARLERGKIWNNGQFPQIVDTYHLAGQLDKQKSDMDSYTLKYLAHYCGFRKEKRLELTYKQIHEYWRSGEEEKIQLIRDYLIYDLEDQRAVSNYFLPLVWYQQIIFPMPIQEISVASPARKWNTFITKYYRDRLGRYYQTPLADTKIDYQGASVSVFPGSYRNIFKVDVSSLYPSIMLRYGIGSHKDVSNAALFGLAKCKELRMIYKDLANDETLNKKDRDKYKSIDTCLKVAINGLYGFLGTGLYPYNSMKAAAIVTAYGRVFIEIIETVANRFAISIEKDTDGLYASPLKASDVLPEYRLTYNCPETGVPLSFDPNWEYVDSDYIHAAIQAALPEGIKIDLELRLPDGGIYAPKMKNYIYWANPDSKAKCKGTIFRGRSRSKLQKEFPIEYARLMTFKSKDSAEAYYREIRQSIEDGSIPLEMITIRKRIGKAEKALISMGLGEVGDKIYYYWSSYQGVTKTGKPKKNRDRFAIRVNVDEQDRYTIDFQETDDYWARDQIDVKPFAAWYLADLDKIKSGIDCAIGI